MFNKEETMDKNVVRAILATRLYKCSNGSWSNGWSKNLLEITDEVCAMMRAHADGVPFETYQYVVRIPTYYREDAEFYQRFDEVGLTDRQRDNNLAGITDEQLEKMIDIFSNWNLNEAEKGGYDSWSEEEDGGFKSRDERSIFDNNY